MADDINLPNLVSHLQVNLGNTNGIVADATRQGSSVGQALGQSMQRTLRNALDDIPEVELNGDTSELDRDLHRVRRDLQRLSERRIGVDISIEDALREMERLEPHLERLQRTHPSLNVVAAVGGALADLEELRLAAREVDETDVDIDVDVDSRDLDQLNRRFDGVRQGLSRITGLIGGLGKIAVPFAAAGAAVGTLAPLLAGVATALANIAPAAGLAATGVLAVGLANASLKIGLMGVEDALKSAFDPDGAEAYAEALKKLAPNARTFVETIKSLGPQFDKLKLRVQNNLFEGLGKTLKTTVKAIGPDLSLALTTSAGALNRMGRQVLNTATGLSKSGAFGQAIGSATTGLYNLIPLPATIVQGLIQIGAAAGPAFERLTRAGGGALERLSQRMTTAFESGGMERAIEQAIDLLGQLGRVAGNVFGIIGNVARAASTEGGGLFGTLESITGALRNLTASKEFQVVVGELTKTMKILAREALPLVTTALGILSSLFIILAPVVRDLAVVLGDTLNSALAGTEGPLTALAEAIGIAVQALFPFIELGGDLIEAILPALVPLFETFGRVITEMTPFLEQLADTFAVQLLPILERLPEVLEAVLPVFERAAAEIFPELTRILGILAPYLEDLAVELGELLVQLAPVMADFLEFSAIVIGKLVPILGPILGGVIIALTGTLRLMVGVLEGTVLPALRTAGKVLTGDFSGALREAGVDAGAMKNAVSTAFNTMAGSAIGSVARMASSVGQEAARAGARLYSGVMTGVNQVRTILGNLPSIARGAAAGLGGALVAAGAALIGGLISGISSKIGEVRSKLGELTSMIPDWKGPARKDAKLLTPAGKSIIQGLIDGITATTPKVKSTLASLTRTIERAIDINKGNRKKLPGLGSLLDRVERDNKKLLSLAKSRDKVAATLKAAQKKLDDLVKERSKAAADIRDGILGEANITGGMSVVNSVAAITVGLQVAVKKVKEFGANLAKLKKAGLRSDVLGDIGRAGVDGGSATAAALAKATPAELKRINDLQAQLASAATSTGNSVAGALYDSGVRAAQGLVDGLKRQQGAIEKQMRKIAEAMLKAIRKALDMHSPSRKLKALASLAMEGMPQGFEAMRAKVVRSAASVASAAVTAAQGIASVRPSLPVPGQVAAAYAGAGGGGDTHHTWNLYGSDATPDGIMHTLSWQGLVGRRG